MAITQKTFVEKRMCFKVITSYITMVERTRDAKPTRLSAEQRIGFHAKGHKESRRKGREQRGDVEGFWWGLGTDLP
jgi:hypothetical protein